MKENKPAVIPLHFISIDELLLTPDASIYRKQTIREEVEKFIVEEAKAIHRKTTITLQITLPQNAAGKSEAIRAAIHKHFAYEQQVSIRKLKHTLALGWRSLLIGFCFTALLFLVSELISSRFPTKSLLATIGESLVILGWVALWRPAELLLYEWRPCKRDAALYGRLAESDVKIVFEQKG